MNWLVQNQKFTDGCAALETFRTILFAVAQKKLVVVVDDFIERVRAL